MSIRARRVVSVEPVKRAWPLLAAALLWTACERAPEPAGAAPLAGAAARERVVSLSPLASRFVLALGAAHLLVAVDPVSRRLPELAELPVAGPGDAEEFAPTLVLTPDPPVGGAEWVEFSPHDLGDVFELARGLGARLAGAARASRFEAELARSLSDVAGSSFGQTRPRTLGVVGTDPLLAAGGHSFGTDLIEIAGGSSVTHAGEEPSRRIAPDDWASLAPELVVVFSADPLPPARRRAVLARVPDGLPVEFLTLDLAAFWLEDAAAEARRLAAVIGAARPRADR